MPTKKTPAPCRPSCAGWYIVKETGRIRACKACGIFTDTNESTSDEKAQRAADRLYVAHPPKEKRDCEGPTCHGWATFEAKGYLEIERCDVCNSHVYDDDVFPVAIAFFESVLPGKRIGRRANARTRARLAL